MYYVYILKCSDHTLYCGTTNNLEKRVDAHNGISKGGSKYTASRRPVEIIYSEEYLSKNEALKREIAIKKLTRQQKLTLISGGAQQ